MYIKAGLLLAFVFACFELPSAAGQQIESPQPHVDRLQWALLATDAGARTMDMISTRRALQCTCNHESMLPDSISHNTMALSAFEAGVWGFEYITMRKLEKRHPKLARWIPAVDAVGVSFAVAGNMSLRTSNSTSGGSSASH